MGNRLSKRESSNGVPGSDFFEIFISSDMAENASRTDKQLYINKRIKSKSHSGYHNPTN